MFTINDLIIYILSFFIPAVKKDLYIQTIIENQIIIENNELENYYLYRNKNI
jgi:hypothetical protein